MRTVFEHGEHCQDNECTDERPTIACAHGRIDFMHGMFLRMAKDLGDTISDMTDLLRRIQQLERRYADEADS